MSNNLAPEDREAFRADIGDLYADCKASEERLAMGVGRATGGEEVAYLLSTLTKAVLLLSTIIMYK